MVSVGFSALQKQGRNDQAKTCLRHRTVLPLCFHFVGRDGRMLRQAIHRLRIGGSWNGGVPGRIPLHSPKQHQGSRSSYGIRLRTTSTSPVDDAVDDDVYSKEGFADTGEWAGCRRSFMAPLQINCSGTDTLYNPLFNKGTAFKSGERDRLRFRGLLPYRMTNIHLQKERFLVHLRAETSSIKKNLLLEDLHDRNETLYHRVLVDHTEEMAPLIYTPTVGQACMEFGARFRRPRGMYFTPYDRGNMAASTLRKTAYY